MLERYAACTVRSAVPALIKAPAAAKRPRGPSRWHGVDLIDDYAWLRADNWQDVMRDPAVLDPEIRAHLEAENAYTEAQLADTRRSRSRSSSR